MSACQNNLPPVWVFLLATLLVATILNVVLPT
jgi:hypothetical protein